MQLVMKMVEEIRQKRITLELMGSADEIHQAVETLSYQASGMPDGAPSTDLVRDLNQRIVELNDVITELRQKLASVEPVADAHRLALENRVVNLDCDRMTERARADRAESDLAEAKGKLDQIHEAMFHPDISASLNYQSPPQYGSKLRKAIKNVRQVLNQAS